MPRIKIDFPEKIIFNVSMLVRISDINYGNHVGNDAFVSILHEARMQWLSSYGHTELNIEGTGLIMAGLSIQFKAEAHYGEMLNIQLAIAEVSQLRFTLFYNITTIRNDKVVTILTGETAMVSYDYSKSKTTAIPEKFRLYLIDKENT